MRKAGCCERTMSRVLDAGERPGALWHIYDPRDADKIRQLLTEVSELTANISSRVLLNSPVLLLSTARTLRCQTELIVWVHDNQAPVFPRQILPNSAAPFVKFSEIPLCYYPKYPTFHGQLAFLY